MTSFGYRLNPRYTIKECLSCGALYIGDFCCSKGNVEDKILVPKLPKNCARCGYPVNGPYYQGCTLLREKLEEDLDHGVNPPHIDECCCECGDALDGIFYQQCTCKSCGKGAHIGYNCPPKVPIISNPKPCDQTMNNELPQTLPSFDSTCYSDKENSVPCVSKPNFVDESNIFNPPPQPPIYSCEFCGSNAQYGHYCMPQVSFISGVGVEARMRLFNVNNVDKSGDLHPQQYPCCDTCGGLHETFQCQPMNQNSYNSNFAGFDQSQTPQFPVIHPPPQETSIEILHDHENVINFVQTFLRKFNRYSFFETPKVLLLAWDRVFKIKDALGNKQYKPDDTQELFRELFNDVQNIHEELAEYINTLGWNRPAFYDDEDDDDDDVDYTIAITPVLSIGEPDNTLSMGDEHLDTILAAESDEVIKSSVEDLIPIPSESEGIPEHKCDVPFHDNSLPLDVLKDQFEDFSESNDEFSSINDDSFSIDNIDYVEASPPDSELASS
nr:hypothetical protein [Tanacetum cinerariifolium]